MPCIVIRIHSRSSLVVAHLRYACCLWSKVPDSIDSLDYRQDDGLLISTILARAYCAVFLLNSHVSAF
jgi:hypothetical protein